MVDVLELNTSGNLHIISTLDDACKPAVLVRTQCGPRDPRQGLVGVLLHIARFARSASNNTAPPAPKRATNTFTSLHCLHACMCVLRNASSHGASTKCSACLYGWHARGMLETNRDPKRVLYESGHKLLTVQCHFQNKWVIIDGVGRQTRNTRTRHDMRPCDCCSNQHVHVAACIR
jgi:hypothetical protein